MIRSRHFNPLPPHGGRRWRWILMRNYEPFQSTPSTRRETDAAEQGRIDLIISIHSLHTEGDSVFSKTCCDLAISIHSLHTEGDRTFSFSLPRILNFNPLPPHGGRPVFPQIANRSPSFQSTPSTRRETLCRVPPCGAGKFQSTPSTRRETTSVQKL